MQIPTKHYLSDPKLFHFRITNEVFPWGTGGASGGDTCLTRARAGTRRPRKLFFYSIFKEMLCKFSFYKLFSQRTHLLWPFLLLSTTNKFYMHAQVISASGCPFWVKCSLLASQTTAEGPHWLRWHPPLSYFNVPCVQMCLFTRNPLSM